MPKIDDVRAAIAQMQALRSELPDVEAKDARLPQKVYQGLSGFANRRGGGMIIMGLEDGTFRPVGGLNIAPAPSRLPAVRHRWRDSAGHRHSRVSAAEQAWYSAALRFEGGEGAAALGDASVKAGIGTLS